MAYNDPFEDKLCEDVNNLRLPSLSLNIFNIFRSMSDSIRK